MGKINIHSTKYFLSLIFKPRKTFHDLVLYYFICYKAELKRQKNPNKKELIYRYSLIEKDYRKNYSTKFKYILFPFNRSGNNGYKESMEIIILIFRNAPELVVDLFEKDEISFKDTEKLKSDYFNYYHKQIPEINNNFQTTNQLINIRNTENNFNNNFVTTIEKSATVKKEPSIKDDYYKVPVDKIFLLNKAIEYIQLMNFKVKEIIIFSSILFDLNIIEKPKRDKIETRLRVLGNILGEEVSYNNRIKKTFDPNLPKNELKKEKELLILIKDFFTDNSFEDGISHVNKIINKIDNKISPQNKKP